MALQIKKAGDKVMPFKLKWLILWLYSHMSKYTEWKIEIHLWILNYLEIRDNKNLQMSQGFNVQCNSANFFPSGLKYYIVNVLLYNHWFTCILSLFLFINGILSFC